MPFVTVASAKDVSPGRGTLVESAGRKVALFLYDGHYYALDNACPHRGASLVQGTCENGELHCPLHDTRFELTTGRHLCPPAKSDVRSYPVRVEGDDIQIEFDSLGSAAPPPPPRPEWSKSRKHTSASSAAVAAVPTPAPAPAAVAPSSAEADAPAATATAEAPRKKRVRVELDSETATQLTGTGLFFSGLIAGLATAGLVLGGLLYLQIKANRIESAQLREEVEAARQQATETPPERMVTEKQTNPEDTKRIQELGDTLIEDLRLQRVDAVYQMMSPTYQQRYKKEEFAETLQKVTALKWVTPSALQRQTKIARSFGGRGYDYHCTASLTSSIGLLQILATFVPSATGNEWLIERIDFAQEK